VGEICEDRLVPGPRRLPVFVRVGHELVVVDDPLVWCELPRTRFELGTIGCGPDVNELVVPLPFSRGVSFRVVSGSFPGSDELGSFLFLDIFPADSHVLPGFEAKTISQNNITKYRIITYVTTFG